MMLDMKRTFDEIVEAHADPDRAAQILANPFYQSLSSSFAGRRSTWPWRSSASFGHADDWDLIVVDTPPSRSALDFLDAPQRLGRFLRRQADPVADRPSQGRHVLHESAQRRVRLDDERADQDPRRAGAEGRQTFVTAFDTMFGGFRERAESTYRLLQAPGTAFLVVAAPEPDALREASYFVERLDAERMPLAGLILNRVHISQAARLSAARSLAAAETLDTHDRTKGGGPAPRTPSRPRSCDARRADEPEQARTAAGRALHLGSPGHSRDRVIAQPEDVHDLAGLRVIGTLAIRSPIGRMACSPGPRSSGRTCPNR